MISILLNRSFLYPSSAGRRSKAIIEVFLYVLKETPPSIDKQMASRCCRKIILTSYHHNHQDKPRQAKQLPRTIHLQRVISPIHTCPSITSGYGLLHIINVSYVIFVFFKKWVHSWPHAVWMKIKKFCFVSSYYKVYFSVFVCLLVIPLVKWNNK